VRVPGLRYAVHSQKLRLSIRVMFLQIIRVVQRGGWRRGKTSLAPCLHLTLFLVRARWVEGSVGSLRSAVTAFAKCNFSGLQALGTHAHACPVNPLYAPLQHAVHMHYMLCIVGPVWRPSYKVISTSR
jgi:hypothetical protein